MNEIHINFFISIFQISRNTIVHFSNLTCLPKKKTHEYIYIYICKQIKKFHDLQRITIKEIKKHPWFVKNLPRELSESTQSLYCQKDNPSFSLQSIEEIMRIVGEARTPPPASTPIAGFGWGEEESDHELSKEEEEEEYEKHVRTVHESGEFHIN